MTYNHIEEQDWNDNRIVLTVQEGDGWTAYCSPEATGKVFVDGKVISDYGVLQATEAPFKYDLVFDGRFPNAGEVDEITEGMGQRFADQFDSKVDEIYEHINGADNAFDAIMSLEPDDLP